MKAITWMVFNVIDQVSTKHDQKNNHVYGALLGNGLQSRMMVFRTPFEVAS